MIQNLPSTPYLSKPLDFTHAQMLAIEEDRKRWHEAVKMLIKDRPETIRRWLNGLKDEAYREDMRRRLNAARARRKEAAREAS